jgi:ABC-type uncharacterized transport system permease subunit
MIWSGQIVNFLHDRRQIHQLLRHILKKTILFSQSVRNLFVPAEIEHDPKTERNTGVNDNASHLHSFAVIFFLHTVIRCYKNKSKYKNWRQYRPTTHTTHKDVQAI